MSSIVLFITMDYEINIFLFLCMELVFNLPFFNLLCYDIANETRFFI